MDVDVFFAYLIVAFVMAGVAIALGGGVGGALISAGLAMFFVNLARANE